jgi:hypothetical protein
MIAYAIAVGSQWRILSIAAVVTKILVGVSLTQLTKIGEQELRARR